MMKSVGQLLLSVTFLLLTIAPALAQNQHLGLWKGIDETGKVGYINFDSAGYAYFVLGRDTLGGQSFTLEGQEAYMTYQVDYSEPLKTMDFTIFLKNGDMQVGRLPGIFKFDKKGRMTLCVNFEGEARPEVFEKDNSIELERVATKKSKE